MSDDLPDLTDPLVFDLLLSNHRPEEQTIKRADGKAGPSIIVCEQDGLAWPCPTRLRLNRAVDPRRRGEPPPTDADRAHLKMGPR